MVVGMIMLASSLIWGVWARLVPCSIAHIRSSESGSGVFSSCKRIINYLQASSIPFGSHRLYTNILHALAFFYHLVDRRALAHKIAQHLHVFFALMFCK